MSAILGSAPEIFNFLVFFTHDTAEICVKFEELGVDEHIDLDHTKKFPMKQVWR